MPKQKIIKSGNSLAVTIPSRFVHTIGIKAGQEVEVEVLLDKGKMVYSFSGIKQLLLSNNFVKKRK